MYKITKIYIKYIEKPFFSKYFSFKLMFLSWGLKNKGDWGFQEKDYHRKSSIASFSEDFNLHFHATENVLATILRNGSLVWFENHFLEKKLLFFNIFIFCSNLNLKFRK